MGSYLDYTVEDFVDDLSFIRWAIGTERNAFFEDFYENNPHKRQAMDEAIEIVHYFEGKNSGLDDKEVYKLWKRIKAHNKPKRPRKFRGRNLKLAAILLFLVAVGSTVYISSISRWNPENYLADRVSMADTTRPRLMLSNSRVVYIPSDTAQIRYDASGGSIRVNSRKRIDFSHNPHSIHRLVIPRGKTGRITLSDGTDIRINSSSRLIYPSAFGSSRRKVYLAGEAYFEVSREKERPFKVETSELDINVLGTSFNVTAYPEEASIKTVVVKGKVQVRKKGFSLFCDKMELTSSQRGVYETDSRSIVKDKVDVRHYTSWKEGYLYIKEGSLRNITQKLSRIYDIDIVLDKKLSSVEFSGKLDIRKDVEYALNIIATARPVQYAIKKKQVIIKPEP